MADKSAMQHVLGWMADFLDWGHDMVTGEDTRTAIIADLGGTPPARGSAASPAPRPQLDSVRAYRDAANPTLEGYLTALQDLKAAFETVKSVAEAVEVGGFATLDEATRAVMDLLATNYVRLRYPRAYYFMQVLNFGEEATSVYGDGRTSYGRFGKSILGVLEFVFGPGSSWKNWAVKEDAGARYASDHSLLILAGVFAFWKRLGADDVLYGFDLLPGLREPTAVDRALARMLTLKFAKDVGDTSSDVVGARDFATSLAFVPEDQGGPGMFVGVGGGFQLDGAISRRWHLVVEMSNKSAVSVLIGWSPKKFEAFVPDAEDADFRASIALEARPDEITGTSYELFPLPETGVRLGLTRFEASFTREAASIQATLRNGALLLSPKAFDDFLGNLLPADGLRLPFDFTVGLASDRGVFLEGQVPFQGSQGGGSAQPRRLGPASDGADPTASARIALAPPPLPPLPNPEAGTPGLSVRIPIGKTVGPVNFHDLQLRLSKEDAAEGRRFVAEVSSSLSAKLGPVVARVDRIGIRLGVSVPEDSSRANLGLFDLDFGVRMPDGIGLAIDVKGFVTGGGFLFHDRQQELYAGVLQLTVKERLTLTAVGLIATRMPDGSKGYSLLIFITAEGFQPVPLGMGFTLQGIGGMLAINRTFDERAMREGLDNNTLADLLFPRDVIRRAPEILRSLATTFPASEGSYLFGPLAKIGWASPTLIFLELAVIFEFGARYRLIILGRISSLLPSRSNDLLRLNMDAMGLIDFDQGTASLDAVLVDSRLAHKFVLTGKTAARMRWSSGPGAGFALAVGGFNPRFAPPVEMPKLDRITINLSSGDNPRLTCAAYFAITPNTIQFGAHASLYAAAYGFSVQGDVGFDVLAQLLPFHFVAAFHASVQLKRGSRNLFKVSVAGELEGPRPLRVSAKATFEVLWCDVSIRFDKTLVAGEKPEPPPAIDVLAELKRALSDERNWSVKLPEGERDAVVMRGAAPGGLLALHPLGNLMVKQTVVPLNTKRDLDQFGGAPVRGQRRFKIDAVTLNGEAQTPAPLKDLFAPAQFFDMPDDERLACPSFEEMESGLLLGSEAYVFPEAAEDRVEAPLEYESKVIGADGAIVAEEAYALPQDQLFVHARFGSVANALVRRSGVARFRDTSARKAIEIVAPAWLMVATTDLQTSAPEAIARGTWTEMRAALKLANRAEGFRVARWQLARAHEVST